MAIQSLNFIIFPSFLPLLIFFCTTFIIIIICWSLKKIYYDQHNREKRLSNYPLPPGPNPWPVFGSIFDMLKNKPTHEWVQNIMNQMKTEISCIRLGQVHVIVVTSPELGLEFFKKQDPIFSSRPHSVTADLSSNGYLSIILSPYGDHFKKMKKLLISNMTAPSKYALHVRKKISEEADHATRYVLNQCRRSRTLNGGSIVKVRTVARHFTINVMKRVVFNKRFFNEGMDDGGPGDEDEEHVNALLKIIEHIHSFSVSDFLPWLRFLDLDGHNKNVKKALEIVRKYHNLEIEERVLMYAKGLRKDEEEDEDFLDVLLKLKDDNGTPMLTVKEIEALIIDLMLASTDNPSNVVEWTLAEMINQPEMLEKATKELDNVVGKTRLVEESDLPKLNYIKSCIRESFRLHPVSPFNLPHLSMEDTVVSGYFIPKGSHVLLNRFGIGRNPRIWDQPMKFEPERHMKILEEKKVMNININDIELNSFSFGIGRRGCPGVTIGSTMVTFLLARLIQGFTWTIPPGVSKVDLVTKSKNDLHLLYPLLAFAKPRLTDNLYPELENFYLTM